jgi:Predicted hydrolases or acyltransferases (alpha/beta hydrolase superfamily)
MTKISIRRILLISVLIIILAPCIYYILAIDLSRSHSKKIAALPLYETQSQSGAYRLEANDLEFHIRTAGMDNQGDGVVLLHGFPNAAIMWEPLMKRLSSLGYRVVAFDQRGYSPGARPKGKENYHIDLLVGDVLAVAGEVGLDSFHLVGHDWGRAVGWKTVMDHPDRIRSWTAMSVPHVGVFFNNVINNPIQAESSQYIYTLRRPIVPEFLYQLFKKRVVRELRPIWSESLINEVQSIFSEHGGLTAALNWYRAIDIEEDITSPAFQKSVKRPTLYLWGVDDPVISSEIIPLQVPYIDTTYQEIKLECGHSLIQEKEEEVITAIESFLASHSSH